MTEMTETTEERQERRVLPGRKVNTQLQSASQRSNAKFAKFAKNKPPLRSVSQFEGRLSAIRRERLAAECHDLDRQLVPSTRTTTK